MLLERSNRVDCRKAILTTKYLGVNHIFSKPKHTTSLKKVSIAGVLLLLL